MNLPETKNPIASARIVGCGVDPREYHKRDCERGDPEYVMSRGELCLFSKNPLKWICGYEEETNGAMSWGDSVDCLYLTPEQFQHRFAVQPGVYPVVKEYKDEFGDPATKVTGEKPWNNNAAYCREWNDHKRSAGLSVISQDTYTEAQKAVQCLCSRIAPPLQVQVHIAAEYHDAETGLVIPIRCLLDMMPSKDSEVFKNGLADLKTTADASPRAWSCRCYNHGLDLQAALYLDAFNAATGEARDSFYHIVQESDPPYIVTKYLLSQDFVVFGRMKYTDALKRYCQCLKTDQWPGYATRDVYDGWNVLTPEAWMIE